MFRATRTAVTALLALAIAALPVVLERCDASCEAHRHTVASTPTCHHTASTVTRISEAPAPCGHDHATTVVTAAKGPAPTGRTFDSIVAVETRLTVASPTATDLRVRPHSPPNSSATVDRRSLPLRV